MKPSDPASDDTLLPTAADSGPRDVPAPERARPEHYQLGTVLGQGGMGEVVLATDPQIGREVAIKRMRGDLGASAEARFLREAKIQARLDHPAIVPVHEIGRDREGRPFFTMKRLTGSTLAETLAHATPQRLLRTFVEVCSAIDFAHTRGIVHRDLKPANIMLGDFGEVYVIDWGLARVFDEEDHATSATPADQADSGQTEAGALLGTPGYMSPEQARGESVGPATDIYALGSILFEILTREPLHPRGAAAIASTLQRPTAAPSERKRDVPPELCAATRAALAALPGERPTARALGERVQNYLDGDRDLELRRTLAARHLRTARDAFRDDDRAVAMVSAGRALALDPELTDAAQILTSLTLEPPAKNPPELDAHLEREDLSAARRQWKQVALSWIAFYAAFPLVMAAGVHDTLTLIVFYAAVTVCFGSAAFWSRRGQPHLYVTIVGSVVTVIALSRFVGPFFLVPTILAVMGNGFLSYPSQMRKPIVPIIAMLGSFSLILALEYVGVFARTWTTAGGTLIVHTGLGDLDGPVGTALIVVTNLATILVSALFARSIAAARYNAHRTLEIQAWHLRKLVPA